MPQNPTTRGSHYLWLCLAASLVTFVGFSSTYFGPMIAREYPEVSPVVHLHGWTFFLYYLVLPIQAGLVAASRVRLHRTLGYCSIALAVAMTATGLLVIGFQMDLARQPNGSPFWQQGGPPVFVTLVLFAVFYTLAVWHRRKRELHKRLILLASSGALGAAGFRVMGMAVGFGPIAVYGGILLPNLIIVAAMLVEWLRGEGVHPIYRWGLPMSVLAETGMMAATPTAAGKLLSAALATLGAALAPLY